MSLLGILKRESHLPKNQGAKIRLLPDGSATSDLDVYLRSEEGQAALERFAELGERIKQKQAR